jgi:chemotaxis regulatin CheY-phosphate phosphatase CheZ
MSSMIVKPPDDEQAYEQIEAAVMETSRGRWFLAEYARRNRHSETELVLSAIDKLQRSLGLRGGMSLPADRLQGQILEMARAIAQTEREIRAIRPDGATATQYGSASSELAVVVDTTEKATSNILSAAEKVQEYAWTMRERSGNEAECDLLDACATDIYTACGFQDLTAQRIRKVVETLGFIDERIKSLLEATGLAEDFHADEKMIGELDEPRTVANPAADIWMSDANQAEIDDTFDFFVPAEISEPTMIGAELMDIEPVAPLVSAPRSRKATPAAKTAMPDVAAAAPESPYDGLSTEQKMRAFR